VGAAPAPLGFVALTAESTAVVRNSLAVGFWVVVSRVTGVVRVAATAAVLGVTYFGNTFQALNLVPNLAFEVLAGTLFGSLLIPRLVRRVDTGEPGATERFVNGFLGVAAVAFAGLTAAAIVAGPVVLRLFTIGVRSAAVASDQRRVGVLLLALLMPQMLLYGLAAIGAAVMNAHGRFALAAAAPSLENIGVTATLVATALVFGTGVDVGAVKTAHVVLLGVGTTTAVAFHAAAMWWGAWRTGVVLRPRAGWRDPEVREMVRWAVPSLGYVWLNVTGYFTLLVVANRVQGGVVAFQLAFNFFSFPVAVAAEPVAVAVRPRLARLYRGGDLASFRDQLVQAGRLVAFFAIPAAVAFFTLAVPLGRAVAIGAMATPTGMRLVAWSVAALAVAVIGESAFRLVRDAAYARDDVGAPCVAMVVRTAVAGAIIVPAYLVLDGPALLAALGASVSAGSVAGAWILTRRVGRGLPPGNERLLSSLRPIAAGSVLMAAPAYLVATHGGRWTDGNPGRALTLVVAAGVGFGTFLALQRRWASTELRSVMLALRRDPAGGVLP